MLNESVALERIASIRDVGTRTLVSRILEDTAEFYGADITRLRGSFDLAFFVSALIEQSSDISGLINGSIPVEYWFEDYPRPIPVRAVDDPGPTIRSQEAFNYAALHDDPRIQAALLGLMTRATTKHAVFHPNVKSFRFYGPNPPVHEMPVAPLDYLFMLTAVAYALEPGRPARRCIEESPTEPPGK
jgi:hypothetical protein